MDHVKCESIHGSERMRTEVYFISWVVQLRAEITASVHACILTKLSVTDVVHGTKKGHKGTDEWPRFGRPSGTHIYINLML